MEAILIGGIPGSGKTTLALQLKQQHVLIDDPLSFSCDVAPHFGEDLVITDPHLSFSDLRQLAKERLLKEGYTVFEILLLTPIDLCWERVKSRNDERNITLRELNYFHAGLNSR